MKRYWLLILILIPLFLLGAPGMAFSEEDLSVAEATKELAETIEERPVSLVDYADTGAKFLLRVTEKLWTTGKPMVAFKNKQQRLGLEFNVFEEPRFSLTAGKFFLENNSEEEKQNNEDQPVFDKSWFWGIELKGIPFASDISEVFEKLRPQLLFYEKKTWIGLSYKFRNEIQQGGP